MAIMNCIAFENLRAEMGRKNLTIGEMASAITRTCFPGKSVEYLFKEAVN